MNIAVSTASRRTHVFERALLVADRDPVTRALWVTMSGSPRPCFSMELLKQARELHALIKSGAIDIDFYVIGSSHADVFNLGGDLGLFSECILDGRKDQLTTYARLCIEILNDFVTGFGRQVISVSQVQGEAKGGGFELALATDFVIAEKRARFGFPEILFNLFPGMGAYSFLARKVGPQSAQRMILGAASSTAEELNKQGIVDIVSEDHSGAQAAERFIRDTSRQVRGFKAFLNARRRADFWVSERELTDVVMAWVDCAMQASERDLKLMGKIVSAQKRIA